MDAVPKCQICSVENAQIKCNNCQKMTLFCDACFAFAHKSEPNNFHIPEMVSSESKASDKQGIDKENISIQVKTVPILCESHKEKSLDYFCNICLIPICGDCLISTHKLHDAISAIDKLNEIGKKAEEYLKKIEIESESINKMKIESNFIQIEIKDQIIKLKSYIETTFDKLISSLIDKKNDILEKIEHPDSETEPHIQLIEVISKQLKLLYEELENSKMVLNKVKNNPYEMLKTISSVNKEMNLIEEKMDSSFSYNQKISYFRNKKITFPLLIKKSVNLISEEISQLNLDLIEENYEDEKDGNILLFSIPKMIKKDYEKFIENEDKKEVPPNLKMENFENQILKESLLFQEKGIKEKEEDKSKSVCYNKYNLDFHNDNLDRINENESISNESKRQYESVIFKPKNKKKKHLISNFIKSIFKGFKH